MVEPGSTQGPTQPSRPPIAELVAQALASGIALVKAEISAFVDGSKKKAQESAIAVALFAAAAFLALFVLGYLIFAIYLAFTIIVAPWLAALIVAGILVLVVAGLGIAGKTLLKRRKAPSLGESVADLKASFQAGVGAATEPSSPSKEL